eukprot:GHVR01176533.1.p1 GENE.GHVR01176533.1~~GHVR01176533.1.p1  ORF type:complete len:379 (+),score=114.33 GHVR01176533.1:146-1282(+)
MKKGPHVCTVTRPDGENELWGRTATFLLPYECRNRSISTKKPSLVLTSFEPILSDGSIQETVVIAVTSSDNKVWVVDFTDPSSSKPTVLAEQTFDKNVTCVALNTSVAKNNGKVEFIVGLEDGLVALLWISDTSKYSKKYGTSRKSIIPLLIKQRQKYNTHIASRSITSIPLWVIRERELENLNKKMLLEIAVLSCGCLLGAKKYNPSLACNELFPYAPIKLHMSGVTSICINPMESNLIIISLSCGTLFEINLNFGRCVDEYTETLFPLTSGGSLYSCKWPTTPFKDINDIFNYNNNNNNNNNSDVKKVTQNLKKTNRGWRSGGGDDGGGVTSDTHTHTHTHTHTSIRTTVWVSWRCRCNYSYFDCIGATHLRCCSF